MGFGWRWVAASAAVVGLSVVACDDNACIRQSDCPGGTHCSAELVCVADSTDDGGDGDGGVLFDLGGVDLAGGDLASGDLAGADLLTGDLATGDLPKGDLTTGDLLTGDLLMGDLVTGDLAGVDLLTDDASMDLSVGDAGAVDAALPSDMSVPVGDMPLPDAGVDMATGG